MDIRGKNETVNLPVTFEEIIKHNNTHKIKKPSSS
jgi:hypothetical protein